MKILVDANVWAAREAFSCLPNAQVQCLDAQQFTPSRIADADALIVRSGVRIGKTLLRDSKVSFIGTATIGRDHIDTDYLQAQGITFADAAGSSTESVLEYVLASLLSLHHQQHIHLEHDCIGIIGMGRIGSRVAEVLKAWGVRILCNDPPLAEQQSTNFVELSELLQSCALISLHTPLTTTGKHPSFQLIAEQQLHAFQGRAIINAARGDIIHNQHLYHWLKHNPKHAAVLDCWQHEPNIHPQLCQAAYLATPHIAGHSLEGKAANSAYIHRALCKHLAIDTCWQAQLATIKPLHYKVDEQLDDWENLYHISQQLYPIEQDSKRLKSSQSELALQFKQQRKHYPIRRSWTAVPLHTKTANDSLLQKAKAAGIQLSVA